MRTLVWFRRDLRVADNMALYHAAKESSEGVVGLYLATPEQWELHDDADCKVGFWMRNLQLLSKSLAKKNIPLVIDDCKNFHNTADTVVRHTKQSSCQSVFINREYEVNELNRDAATKRKCEAAGIDFRRFHDRVIVPPREIATKDGRFYSVFTPYKNVWNTRALGFCSPLPRPGKQQKISVEPSNVPQKLGRYLINDPLESLWPAGENEARKRLTAFGKSIQDYGSARDIPSQEGTSNLSPYLAAGVISPRQCLASALTHNQGEIEGPSEGAKIWISELTWRDFYAHVMVGFPRVSKDLPFKRKTAAVPWRDSQTEFEAWSIGQTGYPIVDAGMRQLNQTGWMHNRLRMVTAMFLTKNLLIDWRMGQRYFMEKLIDGDLAANNGGWQWSASTGTDSVPYFRIFNPFSQSKRFDVEGNFIKAMCPELEPVPAKSLHDPAKLSKAIKELNIDYPDFVVEYKFSRERALAAFKSLNQTS